MNDKVKEKFTKYADVKAKIALLEAEEAELKVSIMLAMKDASVDKVESDRGIFSLVAGRKSYKYSDKVKTLENEVKQQKIVEESNGTAELIVGESSLRFTPAKD